MSFRARFLSALSRFKGDDHNEQPENLVEGGLYSTRDEKGAYAVIKILKLDDVGVHIRLYSNQFTEHPTTLDESTLYMAGVDHGPNESLGMGHLPVSRESFAQWGARFIKTVDVTEDELDGYAMWKEASGGYF